MVVVKNDIPIFGWVFMSIWMGMLLLFTWLFVRDGGFHQFSPLVETGIILLFWLFGLGGSGELFGQPRIRITVGDDGVATVEQRYLLRRTVERVPGPDLVVSEVKEGRDSEGDPYFRCSVSTSAGRIVTIAESGDRATVEARRATLLAALA